MNSALNKDVYVFLVNNDFINFVINPTYLLKKTWKSFFKIHPELIAVAEEAKKILMGETLSIQLSSDDASDMKNNVLKNILAS